jgi:hypothetical protein
MKIMSKKFLVALLVMGVVSGCTLKQMIKIAKDQKLEVSPNPLELHGDSVGFVASANLPLKMMKKKTTYTVEFAYRPTNKEAITVGSVSFDGNKIADKKKPMKPEVKQYFSFPYDPAKHTNGEVEITGTAKKGEKTRKTETLPIAKGIITTSRLVLPTFSANYVDHGYKYVEEYENVDIAFYFERGKSELRKTEISSTRGKDFEAYIAALNPTKSVTIDGTHSPEGPETINTELANERANVIKKHYETMLKKYNPGGAANLQFNIKPVVQDWNALKDSLKNYKRITEEQKKQVADIVNGPGEYVSKELQLQKLPFYNNIFRDVYPQLRVAKARMTKIKKKLTEDEIVALGLRLAKGEAIEVQLKADEIAFAATKTPDLDEKIAIYKKAIELYDANYSYNNLAAVYLEKAKKASTKDEMMNLIDMAVTNLELSLKRKETPEAYVNLAGARLMKGDRKGSNEALAKASGSGGSIGASINALKGYNLILAGNYKGAIQTLADAGNDPAVLYNKSLAYLLDASKTGSDYAKAKSACADAIKADEKNAYAYYIMAVIASRMKDEATMIDNLRKATVLDAKLKERAASDLEFLNYLDGAKFKELLK